MGRSKAEEPTLIVEVWWWTPASGDKSKIPLEKNSKGGGGNGYFLTHFECSVLEIPKEF